MGAYQDAVQGAVVCLITMMGALLDGAFNALVCMAVHMQFLLLFKLDLVWPGKAETYQAFL